MESVPSVPSKTRQCAFPLMKIGIFLSLSLSFAALSATPSHAQIYRTDRAGFAATTTGLHTDTFDDVPLYGDDPPLVLQRRICDTLS